MTALSKIRNLKSSKVFTKLGVIVSIYCELKAVDMLYI